MISPFGVLQPDPIRHPMHRVSDDEMQGRGLCDIKDPAAVLPSHCSVCSQAATGNNPLRLIPVDRSPRALVRAYLYRSVCKNCSLTGRNGDA